jgi:hypothetical protein
MSTSPSISRIESDASESDEYAVRANETTIDDEPGTTVDERSGASSDADDGALTLFCVPIGVLSKQTRFVLSTAMTLLFYGASHSLVSLSLTHPFPQCSMATFKSGSSASLATRSVSLSR